MELRQLHEGAFDELPDEDKFGAKLLKDLAVGEEAVIMFLSVIEHFKGELYCWNEEPVFHTVGEMIAAAAPNASVEPTRILKISNSRIKVWVDRHTTIPDYDNDPRMAYMQDGRRSTPFSPGIYYATLYDLPDEADGIIDIDADDQ